MVVYQAMYDTFQIYVRPLTMFMEEVDRAKYPDAKQKYRFELLQDMEMSAPVQGQNPGQAEALQQKTSAGQAEVLERRVSIEPAETDKKESPWQAEISDKRESSAQEAKSDEQVHIDPLVMEFLDANTYEQRLNVLAALRHRITDDMINTMAAAVELEIKNGDVETRYEELKNCLLTFEKYECNRLR